MTTKDTTTEEGTDMRCTQHPAFEADYCPVCGTTTPIGDRTLGTTPREVFTPSNPMRRAMAEGHLARTGHTLTGYYATPVDGIGTFVRTCGCE